jgi:hypothetical protein
VLPAELKALLLEANGIMELIEIRGTWIANMWLMWKVEEVLARNHELRQERDEGRFPSGSLAFADAGVDGVLFAFDLESRSDVFAWHPMGFERQPLTFSLQEFLSKWIAGGLGV